MGDITFAVLGGGLKRLRDMGDGTYAEVVAAGEGSYRSPKGYRIATQTTLDSLFSDDFGGAAVDLTRWDVLDGGLAANVDLGAGVLTQAKIGSGTTGITDSVSASGLTVAMGIINGAERWYLSKQAFAGKEDILVLLSRSQANVNNSVFIGLVEVDPVTLVPLLNPNFAADGNGSAEFTNRGGCEFGLTATTTAFQAEAIGDSSAAKATGVVGAAGAAMTTTQEFLIEIDSRDIIVSSTTIDNVLSKTAGASRVSSQCPNDTKVYKLAMRFKNIGVPTATSIVIQRILVADNYELRVNVSGAEGDLIANKALAVNLAGAGLLAGQTQGAAADNGNVLVNPFTIGGWMTSALIAIGTTARVGKATMDLGRRLIVRMGGIPQAHAYGAATLSNTTETTVLAAVAAQRHEVQTIECYNPDTVKHTFIIRDATAGTIRWKMLVPPGESRNVKYPALLAATALNANFTAQLGEAVTTTNPEVYMSSYLGTA